MIDLSNHYASLVANRLLSEKTWSPTLQQKALADLQAITGQQISLEQQAALMRSVDPWRTACDCGQQRNLAEQFLSEMGALLGQSACEYRSQLGRCLERAIEKAEKKQAPACVDLPTRCEPLKDLTCVAHAGNYEDPRPGPRLDPLILIFGEVEKSTPSAPTKLFLTNRSKLGKPRPITLPGDTAKAQDGKYSLVLDDAWMKQNGVHPGDVIAVHQEKAGRTSKPVLVKINGEGGLDGQAPRLPPGDVVGTVEQKAMFRASYDARATQVDPTQLALHLAGGALTVRGDEAALEPYAKVQLTNLRTGQRTAVVTTGADGTFSATIAAQAGDPIVISAVDHSHELDRSNYLRRLTCNAGDGKAILATNPTVGGSPDAPVVPEIHLGRMRLDTRCRKLEVEGGFTPGSIVTLARNGHPEETITAIADEKGSLSVKLPFEPYAGDVVDVTAKNPFCDVGLDHQQMHHFSKAAVSTVSLEIARNGCLSIVERQGRVSEGAERVCPADRLDHLFDARDLVAELKGKLGKLDVMHHGEYPRTLSSLAMELTVARPGEYSATVGFDAKAKEVVVTLSPEDGQLRAGLSLTTDGETAGGVAVSGYRAVPEGQQVPVRFVTEEGRVIARGKMNTTSERTASQCRPNLHLTLDPRSLVWG